MLSICPYLTKARLLINKHRPSILQLFLADLIRQGSYAHRTFLPVFRLIEQLPLLSKYFLLDFICDDVIEAVIAILDVLANAWYVFGWVAAVHERALVSPFALAALPERAGFGKIAIIARLFTLEALEHFAFAIFVWEV